LNRAAGIPFGCLQIAPLLAFAGSVASCVFLARSDAATVTTLPAPEAPPLPNGDPARRAVHRTPAPGRPPERTSNPATSVVAATPAHVPPVAVAFAVLGRRESLSNIGTVTLVGVAVGVMIALVGS